MTRHHTIAYPRKWVKATKSVEAHWEEGYQVDVSFTAKEEITRDAEEARELREQTQATEAKRQVKAAADRAKAKLIQLGLTEKEVQALHG